MLGLMMCPSSGVGSTIAMRSVPPDLGWPAAATVGCAGGAGALVGFAGAGGAALVAAGAAALVAAGAGALVAAGAGALAEVGFAGAVVGCTG
jgi:hypothetical protein